MSAECADTSLHVKVRPKFSVSEMKARQAAKLREIREALVADGVVGLTEQAAALGLSRSTAWTIVTGIHKGSGLSVRTINRMLAMPLLPPTVRSTILDYIKEKTAGNYGGARLRKFASRVVVLSPSPLGRSGVAS